jgi:hypothetical protein
MRANPADRFRSDLRWPWPLRSGTFVWTSGLILQPIRETTKTRAWDRRRQDCRQDAGPAITLADFWYLRK